MNLPATYKGNPKADKRQWSPLCVRPWRQIYYW